VILNHDFKSKSRFWFWFQISSCKVISILILKSFWPLILLILFFEIFKITHHVHDVQCCSNLEFCHFNSIFHVQHAGILNSMPLRDCWNLETTLDSSVRNWESQNWNRFEVDFLEEYVTVVEPLAVVLGQLQGDRHCCYGMLVPKPTQLRYKLSVLAADNLTYSNPLAKSLLSGLSSRYARMCSAWMWRSQKRRMQSWQQCDTQSTNLTNVMTCVLHSSMS